MQRSVLNRILTVVMNNLGRKSFHWGTHHNSGAQLYV
jgi:hypothetical protein